jgi:hypothetical protein
MDSTLPVAVPPVYKSRRGWLIAFGVIEILIGCAFLLMIVASAFAFLGRAGASMPAGPISRPALLAIVGLEYGFLAAVFFIGGIGSIRRKNWARIYMLVVSSLWLVFGVLGTLAMAFILPTIMRQQPASVLPAIMHAIMVVMITVMTVLGVLLPTALLVFYSRPSVKATCLAPIGAEGAGSVAGDSALPIPLAILGVWEAFGALSVLAVLFMRVTLVFGIVLHGAAAVAVLLTYSVLSAYAAWAIFRRQLVGWQIALFMAGFWTISMVVTLFHHPDMLQLFRDMGFSDQTLGIYDQVPRLLPTIWVGTVVLMGVLVAFILYTRKFFRADERVEPPVPQG